MPDESPTRPGAAPIRLTQRFADSAKAKDGERTEYLDALIPGLRLIAHPSGHRSWGIRYRHGGKPKRLGLGDLAPDLGTDPPAPPVIGSPLTVAAARIVARDAFALLAAGTDPATMKRPVIVAEDAAPEEDTTFATQARLFLVAECIAKGHRHWPDVASAFGWRRADRKRAWGADNLTLADGPSPLRAWGAKPLRAITRRDVAAILATTAETRRGTATNKVLAAIRHFFNHAMAVGLLDANVADKIPAPVAVQSRDRTLNDDELAAILAGLARLETKQRWNASPFVAAMRLLIYTGARLNEISSLAWSEVDLAKRVVRIEASRMKMRRPHVIYLADYPLAILRAAPRFSDTDLVFTTNGKVPVSAWGLFKKHLDEVAPISPWRIHDLRRTFAAGSARLGVPIHVVEMALAHRSGSFGGIVSTYNTFTYEKETAAALTAWARHVDDLRGVATSAA